MATVVETHPFAAAKAAGREPFKVKDLSLAEFKTDPPTPIPPEFNNATPIANPGSPIVVYSKGLTSLISALSINLNSVLDGLDQFSKWGASLLHAGPLGVKLPFSGVSFGCRLPSDHRRMGRVSYCTRQERVQYPTNAGESWTRHLPKNSGGSPSSCTAAEASTRRSIRWSSTR